MKRLAKPVLFSLCLAGFVLVLISYLFPLTEFAHRSVQSEAKSALAAVYTGENSHFAEWKRYSHGLDEIGFRPEGRSRYFIGFSTQCTISAAETLERLSSSEFPDDIKMKIKEKLSTLPCDTDLQSTFRFYAIGDLKAQQLDIWSINEKRVLNQIQDGTSEETSAFE